MVMNQFGANIKYPYHELPLISTHDRFGLWTMSEITDELIEEQYGSGEKDDPKIELDCGERREDEK